MTTQQQTINISNSTDEGKAVLANLIAFILTKLAENDMRGLILIAGPSGGGKTSVAKKIEAILQILEVEVARIMMDDYYKTKPADAGPEYSFDVPAAQDLDLLHQHLQALGEGKKIQKPVYGFGQKPTTHVEFAPAPVLIVDGLFGLCHKGIRDMALIKLFVTADEKICLARRIARDTKGRDRQTEEAVRDQWLKQVVPGRKQHVDPSAVHADIILHNNDGGGLPCHRAVAELVREQPPAPE